MNGKCAEKFAEEYTHGTCENHLEWCGEVCCEKILGPDTLLTGRQMFLLQIAWTAPGRRKGVFSKSTGETPSSLAYCIRTCQHCLWYL